MGYVSQTVVCVGGETPQVADQGQSARAGQATDELFARPCHI